MKHVYTRLAVSTLLGLGFFVLVSTIHAQSFLLEGNGAGSDNSFQYNNSNSSSTNQSNNGSFQNNGNSNANTGGNSASGNNGNSTITTGNASANTTVITEGNINKVVDPGCCQNGTSPTPTKKPGNTPTPTPGGNGAGNPTPTPTNKPSDGEKSNSNNGGSSSGGSSAGGIGGGQVLGLSATAGNTPEQYLFYAFGSLCLSLGTFVLTGRKSLIG